MGGVGPWEYAIQKFEKQFSVPDGSTKSKNKAGRSGRDLSIVCNPARFAGRRSKLKIERLNEIASRIAALRDVGNRYDGKTSNASLFEGSYFVVKKLRAVATASTASTIVVSVQNSRCSKLAFLICR